MSFTLSSVPAVPSTVSVPKLLAPLFVPSEWSQFSLAVVVNAQAARCRPVNHDSMYAARSLAFVLSASSRCVVYVLVRMYHTDL